MSGDSNEPRDSATNIDPSAFEKKRTDTFVTMRLRNAIKEAALQDVHFFNGGIDHFLSAARDWYLQVKAEYDAINDVT